MLRRYAYFFVCLPLFANAATTHTWPGSANCTASLQACINAASSGDTVLIASNGPIDETINIGIPLTLKNAPGFRPVFSAGRSISAYDIPAITGNWTTQISGLTLLGGDVGVRAFGSGYTANIVLRDLDVSIAGNTYVGAGVGIDNFGSGALTFEIADNYVRTPITASVQGIAVAANNGGTIDGAVHDNRVGVDPGNFPGTIQVVTSGSPSHARVYANRLSGGITVLARNATTLDIISNAIACVPDNGTIGLYLASATSGGPVFNAFNNTVTGCNTGILVADGLSNARLTNNLIAFNTADASLNSATAALLTTDHNLVFGNTVSTPTFNPGPGSVTTDPRLRGAPGNAFLNANSPAIDAGNTADLNTLLANLALPAIDAAGSRRIKGATNAVDIGAFEYGDSTFLHRVNNADPSPDQISILDDASVNGKATAYPQITSNWNPDGSNGIYYDHPVGVVYGTSGPWVLRTEDLQPFPNDARFNVFAPAPGNGNYRHIATPSNVVGFTTQLDDPGLNNNPDRILLVTRDSIDPNGTAYDDPHPIGVFYFSFGGPGSWFISHFDSTSMNSHGTFHVYWQAPSYTAFVHRAQTQNISGNYTLLDHPLLNGHRCVRFHITQSEGGGVFNANYVGVFYFSGRWAIYNQSGNAMAPGTEFHVVVDEQQAFECSDVIFANGFD